jgi:hypothetical protein
MSAALVPRVLAVDAALEKAIGWWGEALKEEPGIIWEGIVGADFGEGGVKMTNDE